MIGFRVFLTYLFSLLQEEERTYSRFLIQLKVSTCTRTHAHMHTHKQSTAKPMAAMRNTEPALGCLSLVKVNPPGAGLVIHRRTVQASQREVVESKVPTPLNETRTVGNLLPQ